jgi:hypothetical protein
MKMKTQAEQVGPIASNPAPPACEAEDKKQDGQASIKNYLSTICLLIFKQAYISALKASMREGSTNAQ